MFEPQDLNVSPHQTGCHDVRETGTWIALFKTLSLEPIINFAQELVEAALRYAGSASH